jgi:hypothetical protein
MTWFKKELADFYESHRKYNDHNEELAPEEKINYATETNQKDNEGNFVITNRRVIIQTRTENTELPIEAVEAVSSTTSTVMAIAAQGKKYYIFMPENQMKYAMAVLKWTAKNITNNQATGVEK